MDTTFVSISINHIPSLFNVSQAIISLFAALILYAMWYKGTPNENKDTDELVHDQGLLWLGHAFLVWSIAGIWPFFRYLPFCENLGKPDDPLPLSAIRESISTLNSAFILLAIAHFAHGWKGLQRFKEKEWQKVIVVVAIIVAFLIVLASPKSVWRITPEFILSIVTVFILGWALFESFIERNFKFLAILSICSCLIVLTVQITDYLIKLKMIENDIPKNLPSWQYMWLLSSKTMLIFTVLSLPMTWAYAKWHNSKKLANSEIKDHISPPPKADTFKITLKDSQEDKDWIVHLSAPGSNEIHIVKFSEGEFKHFLKFLLRRFDDKSGNAGWVTVHGSGSGAHPDQKDMHRIRETIGWMFIEKSENIKSKYRLRVKPEDIIIENESKIKNLLKEGDDSL